MNGARSGADVECPRCRLRVSVPRRTLGMAGTSHYAIITLLLACAIVSGLFFAVAGLYGSGRRPVEPGHEISIRVDDPADEVASSAVLEVEAFDRVNQQRMDRGVAPLLHDPILSDIARAHSEDMARRGVPEGASLEQGDPLGRIQAAGITYRAVSANLAWNNYPDSVDMAVDGWLESHEHRQPIFDPDFTHSGLGVVSDGARGYFYTQIFVQKRSTRTAVSAEEINTIESETFRRVNLERIAHGLAPVEPDEALREVARAHSEDMIRREFFDHDDPDGRNHGDRLAAAGIRYRMAGENLAMNNHPDTVDVAVTGWMNSSGHRNTILTAAYTHSGVGVAYDGNDGFYFTQLFSLPFGVVRAGPGIRLVAFFGDEEAYVHLTDPRSGRVSRHRVRPGDRFDRFRYEAILDGRQGIRVFDTSTNQAFDILR